MAKKIKNIDTIAHNWGGTVIEPSATYECASTYEEIKFANDNVFLAFFSNGLAEVYNDTLKIVALSDVMNLLLGNEAKQSQPFAAKSINGKKLYKRIHGMQKQCVVGDNVFEFVIPYNQCKITGMEMIGGSNCDFADFEIYDTAIGTYSTIPNKKLNQFGFSVNIPKDYYEHKSEYDADLYLGMKIEVHYNAQIAGLIGINFILNELK